MDVAHPFKIPGDENYWDWKWTEAIFTGARLQPVGFIMISVEITPAIYMVQTYKGSSPLAVL